ncbi:MAG TPA: hypothetical protein VG013_17975 [Gemmataceae bacterium]|nr:hypothetical protein [Gemmataceae bacterium]
MNIGAVWENDRFTWTVPIENDEEKPVEVESFSTTCNCLSVEPQSFVLKAGERRELRLQIDLGSQVKPTGEVTVRLSPRLKQTGGTNLAKRFGPEWTVSGQVRRLLAFDKFVYLGRHSELAQPLPVRTIPVQALVPLQSLSAQCDLPGFAPSIQRPERRKFLLRLTPVSPRPAGAFEGTVSLKPILEGGKRLPAQRIRFGGRIVPDIESVPPVLQVGGRRLGEAFEDVVLLRSLTARHLSAVRAEAKGNGLAVETLDGTGLFRIRQRVCSPGSRTNRVRFCTQSSGRPVTIIVPVTYTGVEPH